ncbi:glycoside/pentoside/hexuronide:cation symporter, GPH family [Flavobacterium sp. CF108]|uniref:MFS transporter n=1 Tax=unclassified Flavobacterium TaxID=196869 RepID=UPI0008D1A2B4|nr:MULTISPECIES: MFS transporter [unclassified Flavobacterium]SEN85820.1 glycoside/pentoside/hexuronide:cation symporter, GPH family [Flavobacterium sp. fv08]SHH21114.1 glycoside/pentoside/hexuronide:cation symporter, GPH family [Flavobacterium sp. CF108]
MHDKISLKEKIGYGLGDAASSMFWKIFSMYLLFFYTDVFGLAPAVVGTMFLITRIWDSCFDPIVGIIADRTKTKWGKFRPYLLWVAIPFAVIGVLTFYTPDFDEKGKIIYAYVTYSLMMMIYSLINVPYASLLGVMSSDRKDRNTLSSYRMVFAFGGSLLALWLIEPLVNYFGGSLNSKTGWLATITVFGVITTAFFWACFFFTKERVKPIENEQSNLKEDLKDLLKNKPWWILLGAGIGTLVFNSIRDGAAVYYFKYYVSSSVNFDFSLFGTDFHMTPTSIYLVLGQAANIIGVIVATPIANKIGKKKTFFGAMAVASILSLAFYFFGKEDVLLIMSFQVLISICAGCIFPLIWSMYADSADYSEWKQGRRATGLVFSASSMSQKFGWTIGGAGTGWLLGYYGFQANVEQTAVTQNGIQLMLSILPAIAAAISVAFILFYPLSEEKLQTIEQDLNEKRDQTK